MILFYKLLFHFFYYCYFLLLQFTKDWVSPFIRGGYCNTRGVTIYYDLFELYDVYSFEVAVLEERGALSVPRHTIELLIDKEREQRWLVPFCYHSNGEWWLVQTPGQNQHGKGEWWLVRICYDSNECQWLDSLKISSAVIGWVWMYTNPEGI